MPGIAERLLRRYLGYNQALGHYLYDRYVQRWQEKIGQSETEKRDLTTGLYDDVYLYDRELLRFLVIPPPPLFYDTTETLCPPPSDGQTW